MSFIDPNQSFTDAAAIAAPVYGRRKDDDLLAELAATQAVLRETFVELAKARVALAQSNKEKFTDALTGILNRGGLENALNNVQQGDVLLMIDLDKFKHINDTYGHLAGDAALKTVAEYLAAKTRDTDTVARLGGDEFVVILRGIENSLPNIKTIELRLGLDRGLSFNHQGQELSVFGSIGKMEIDPSCTPHEILDRADRELYAVKKSKKAAPKQQGKGLSL